MSHTLSDQVPAVAAALEELIKDNGILVLAAALRKVGWEGRDLDQAVEDSVMEELRNTSFGTDDPPKRDENLENALAEDTEVYLTEPSGYPNGSTSMTDPPEWGGWDVSYNGLHFMADGLQSFDAEGNLVISPPTPKKTTKKEGP